MNRYECEELNIAINQTSKLRGGFFLSGFLIQPHFFHITNPRKDGQLNKHSHPTFEISMIMEGVFTYVINNKEFILKAGDLIIIPPRLKHSWKWHNDQAIIANFMCLISWRGVQPRQQNSKLIKSIENHQYHISQFADYEKCILDIIKLLSKPSAFNKDELRNLQKASYIFFLKTLLPDFSDNELVRNNFPNQDKGQLVNQIKHYIYDNLSRSISLDELQKNFGYSKEHLNRVFKKQQNITIGRFIMEHKIELAVKKLGTTYENIKTIAFEIGFSEVSYFCTVFKKFTGKSPAEFRKKIRKS